MKHSTPNDRSMKLKRAGVGWRCSRFLLLTLPVLLLFPSVAKSLTLEELKLSFDVRREQIDKGKADAITAMGAQYAVALERIKDKAQEAGDLEAVLRIKEEIDTAKSGKSPLPALPEGASAKVESMRKIYAKQVLAIEKKWANDTVEAADKMVSLLDKQVISLTKAGKLEDAKSAKQYKDQLGSDPDILSAKAMSENVSNDGKSRPAMRLRRHGDNIEVLVRYDGRGKISMDSPVESVRGKSGKADTTAKTLGEFVGGKGHTVDPYVSYHQVFDGDQIGGLVPGQLVKKYRQKAGGERGMSLGILPTANNPHGSINPSLPGSASPGSFQITCRYFIPKENKSLIGVWFVHGAGPAIERKNLLKRGAWTEEIVSGESSFTSEQLVIHFLMAEGKKYADAKDETVVFGELKVEHVKFTAYISAIYGSNSKPEDLPVPEQKALVKNGEIIITPRALERLLQK